MIDLKKLHLSYIPFIIGMFLPSYAIVLESWLFTIIGILILVAGVIMVRKYSSCPHCGTFLPHLDDKRHPVHFCPTCGHKLEYKK